MKKFMLLFSTTLLINMVFSCSSTVIIKENIPFILKGNSQINIKDGTEVKAKSVITVGDSIKIFLSGDSEEKFVYPIVNVEKITTKSHIAGMFKGFLYGVLLGATGGALTYSENEFAMVLGILGGGFYGAIGGLIFGKETVYLFAQPDSSQQIEEGTKKVKQESLEDW